MNTSTFEQWAIVELFGHTRIAGLVSEQLLGGCAFGRVDVPAISQQQAMTRLFGQGAIYSMTFVDEETARAAVTMMQTRPIDIWSARRMLKDAEQEERNLETDDIPL